MSVTGLPLVLIATTLLTYFNVNSAQYFPRFTGVALPMPKTRCPGLDLTEDYIKKANITFAERFLKISSPTRLRRGRPNHDRTLFKHRVTSSVEFGFCVMYYNENINDTSVDSESWSYGIPTKASRYTAGNNEHGTTNSKPKYDIIWPPGKYCTLKLEKMPCPLSLTEGSLNLSVSVQTSGDPRPDVQNMTSGGSTWRFCCSTWQSAEIRLAFNGSFYLYPYKSSNCPVVHGMRAQRQWEYINLNNASALWSGQQPVRPSNPYGHVTTSMKGQRLKQFMCYYATTTGKGALVMNRNDLLYIGLGVAAAVVLILAAGSCMCYINRQTLRNDLVFWKSIKDNVTSSEQERENCFSTDGKILCNELQQTEEEGGSIGCFLSQILDTETKAKIAKVIIPSFKVKMREKIGQGEFGCVYKGIYQSAEGDEAKQVAVKCVRECVSDTCVAAMVTEGSIMTEFDHPNVMRLLGIVVSADTGLPMLVLPYMDHGDLQMYLRSFRYDPEPSHKTPDLPQMLMFAYHIARGMEYLASLKFVHRDLATRNCMINAQLLVKVSDFGLSRDIYANSYYRQLKESVLPIKWMAVESLRDRVFTSSSDMWSYGVTLWEIWTLAKTPYPCHGNGEILDLLQRGYRLENPEGCPDYLYELMKSCWQTDPKSRPTFSEVSKLLESKLAENHGYTLLVNDGLSEGSTTELDDFSLVQCTTNG